MSTLTVKELSHPAGEVIKIATGKTLDLKSQGTTTLPTGSVLQVVSATIGIATTTTSTSYVNTPLTASITPTSTSSNILITATTPTYTGSNGTYAARYTIFRGTVSGVNLGHPHFGFCNLYNNAGNAMQLATTMSVLDSPNTTSSQTYTVAMYSEGNSALAAVMSSGTKATITLMEVSV